GIVISTPAFSWYSAKQATSDDNGHDSNDPPNLNDLSSLLRSICLPEIVALRSPLGRYPQTTSSARAGYIEHILIATHSGEAGVAEVFRALQNRLRDSTWTVVLKSLITVHLMIREGAPDVTLAYLSKHKNMLAISSFADVQTQGRNIRHYSNYLTERARAYRETRIDWVRGAETRLEKLSVEKGLLRETEIVQHQITALLKCDMSKTDAERAMEIYRTFTKQTDFVVGYLGTARQYEHQTRVEVPKLKHAPVNLGKQLEDYLMDPDFEVNRRQYLAEQEAKKGKNGGKPFPSSSKNEADSKPTTSKSTFPDVSKAQPAQSKPAQPAKGPDPDLIDFFDSIEQNQQTMATQPSFQQTAAPQFASSNPFPVQQAPGNLSSIPQDTTASFPQQGLQPQIGQQTGAPQSTNPFRASMMLSNTTGIGGAGFSPTASTTSPINRQSTNPFAKSTLSPPQPLNQAAPSQEQQFQSQQQNASPLRAMPTGTNPFAKTATPPQQQAPAALVPQPTSTNPFRQSQFVNTATGLGWQNNQQLIGGGLDQVETLPVFPRPAPQQPWQQ
ncbi:hypothetical protein DH86_00003419, partial [Scytalidium sp. 3C]